MSSRPNRHRRALAGIENGEFRDEITPYIVNEHVPDFEHHQVQYEEQDRKH